MCTHGPSGESKGLYMYPRPKSGIQRHGPNRGSKGLDVYLRPKWVVQRIDVYPQPEGRTQGR